MSFNNSGYIPQQYNNLGSNVALNRSVSTIQSTPKNMALNAPMINRVHNVKPGCSACGKKVA